MKKKKKQTVYNLSPSGKSSMDIEGFPKVETGGTSVKVDITKQNTEKEPGDPLPPDGGGDDPDVNTWTIAGITWEKRKWAVILALTVMNIVTLMAVAFKKH